MTCELVVYTWKIWFYAFSVYFIRCTFLESKSTRQSNNKTFVLLFVPHDENCTCLPVIVKGLFGCIIMYGAIQKVRTHHASNLNPQAPSSLGKKELGN